MSVYTPVERDQLTAFLRHYPAGELQVYEGISDGIENTNNFVTTDRQEMVLTLFETHSFDERTVYTVGRNYPSERPECV